MLLTRTDPSSRHRRRRLLHPKRRSRRSERLRLSAARTCNDSGMHVDAFGSGVGYKGQKKVSSRTDTMVAQPGGRISVVRPRVILRFPQKKNKENRLLVGCYSAVEVWARALRMCSW